MRPMTSGGPPVSDARDLGAELAQVLRRQVGAAVHVGAARSGSMLTEGISTSAASCSSKLGAQAGDLGAAAR